MRLFFKEYNDNVVGYLLSKDLCTLYDTWKSSKQVVDKLLENGKAKEFDKQHMPLLPMYPKEFVEHYVSSTYIQIKDKF